MIFTTRNQGRRLPSYRRSLRLRNVAGPPPRGSDLAEGGAALMGWSGLAWIKRFVTCVWSLPRGPARARLRLAAEGRLTGPQAPGPSSGRPVGLAIW